MHAERDDAIRAFLRTAGWQGAKLIPLPGDASTRRYLRVAHGDRNAILMDQPQNAETSNCSPEASAEERQALGYNAVARLAGADCGRFIAVADYLRIRGISAPEIYAADPGQGFVLMEDLGDQLYADVLSDGANTLELYRGAIDALVRLHGETAPDFLTSGKPLYTYDETALLAEVALMTDWFFPVALGRPAREDEILEHLSLWRDALQPILSAPATFVHRDFHAQNLLWLPERTDIARIGMIDFQDAVAGTRSYDLVSLLEDARRDVAAELAERMTLHYLAVMQAKGLRIDPECHRAEMMIMAAQRNVKIVGIFARLFKRDAKPRYLSYLPRVWGYLNRDLQHPALAGLKAWYDRTIPGDRRSVLRMEGLTG